MSHSSLLGVALQVALAQVRPTDGATVARIERSVGETALRRLEFSELLPPDLAVATLAARSADHLGTLARRHAGDGRRPSSPPRTLRSVGGQG